MLSRVLNMKTIFENTNADAFPQLSSTTSTRKRQATNVLDIGALVDQPSVCLLSLLC